MLKVVAAKSLAFWILRVAQWLQRTRSRHRTQFLHQYYMPLTLASYLHEDVAKEALHSMYGTFFRCD